jgi:hypothetical protein
MASINNSYRPLADKFAQLRTIYALRMHKTD